MADSSNAVVYDARKNEVYGVTIYKSNQAEIRRKIVFNVKTGQNIIEIMHLPSCIQQDSVQVSCLGQVDILKSIYHSPGQNSGLLAKLKADDDNAIEELQRNATRLTILNEYALKASQEGTVKQLVDKLNEVEQERRNITNSTKSLQLSHERTAKQLAKQSLLNSRMTILLTASADGPGEIDLAYVVDGATWLPQYEVHASISPEYKKKPAIEICYRAALSQSTGEDWSNVKLMLSTASPLQVSAVPKLAPEFLKIEEDEEEDDDNDDDEDGDEYSDISGGDAPPETISDESDEPVRPKKLANPTAFAKLPVRKSDTQQSNLSTPKHAESHTNPVSTTSLKIPGLITIPSCHDLQSETHQIPLAKIKFESADVQWITVPKEQATVFVQCMIKNTSEMTLLPEKAKVFINDVFVTTSGIPMRFHAFPGKYL